MVNWIIWIVLSTLLMFLISLYLVSRLLLSPKRVPYEKTYKLGIQKGEIDDLLFRKKKKEELFIPSYYGYKLHGMLFPVENSRKVMIIAHGIKWSLFGSFKYVEMFQKRGFNVLLCDHRFHGLSGGTYTSFGYYEKDDLKAWIDYFCAEMGEEVFIGLLGESLGAASALEASKRDHRVKFCIADCAFSDFSSLLRIRLKLDFKLRFYPIIDLVSFIIKLRHGWSFPEVSPIKGLEKTKTPILFIHGKEDRFIPLQMTLDMFKRKKENKKLYLVPRAGHAEAFNVDPIGYEKKVIDFIKEIEGVKANLC
ncbi:alpha/beta hydrolase [Metabacillus halosaccharovorans]|uniref:alpha/beta hydrolase n=1 Tax=Metabacillus halosaccharovorans TaxID=930124 RepID=UPI001C1F9C9B|nr:alpha/beta hydrolase [Metabacillus halosaccharovorans]MBU7594807.1 alpha/beta hydrolase [Metabacillus halosaccharovorans]